MNYVTPIQPVRVASGRREMARNPRSANDRLWRMILAQILRAVVLATGALLLDYALARTNVRYLPSIASGSVIALLVVQVGLGSVWVSIGRDFLPARIVVFLAASLGVWAFLVNWDKRSESELTPACWVQGVIVVGVLLIVRMLRFHLIRTGKVVFSEQLGKPPQFSIRDILIFMTLVSASLAMLVRLGSLTVNHDAAMISCVVGVFLAAMTLISVLSTLVFRHATLPVAFTCGASLLLGWGIGKAIHYDLAVSTLALGGPVILQVAVLLVWRQAGYRLVRAESGFVAAADRALA